MSLSELRKRLQKLEAGLKSNFNYNGVIFVDEHDDGTCQVLKSGKEIYKGTKENAESFLSPYSNSEAVIIWDDITNKMERSV